MRRKTVCIAMVVLVTAAASHLAAALAGPPGSVAFFSARDGNNEIYVMNPDGSDPARVTDNLANDRDPDLSTDGRSIVFTSNRDGNNDIYVVDSDGLNPPINLTNDNAPTNNGWARWSPDGRSIVYHTNRDDGDFEIYMMDAFGNNQTRLTNHVGIDQYPDWSPNGKAIAFRRNTDIYTLDLTDPSATPLQTTIVGPVNQMPAWSPNGRQLAFMSTRAGYCSVFVMNADGTEQTNLTPKNPSDLDGDWCSRAPSWSRNGRQIYFSSFRPATHGIFRAFVMNADGTGVLQLTGTEVLTPKPGPDDSVRPR